ncbi:MAG: carbohydrate ABC transporter substrate-binding protein [Ruminococcus sp.]|nr:carbohydrate ABC transporter substrate-binding protein [Ruminococcus sp.]
MKLDILRAAGLCCALTLSACGSGTKGTVTPPDNSLDACTLRFSWWGGDDRHEATLSAISLWESIHPDIRITPEYGGWDGWNEKVTAQMSSGSEPDILQINYDWLVTMSPDGEGFYDLRQLTGQLDLSGMDEDILSFGTVGGKLNAVAVSVTGRGLFYNSGIYKKVGADYPCTWEELLALGETFSEKGLYPLDLDIQSGGTAWYLAVVYVQQKTGRVFINMDGELGFTEQDITDALTFYKRLEDSRVIRTIRTRTDEDGNAALYQSPEFINGTIAGVLEWGSSVGKYEAVLPEGVLQAGPFLGDGSGNTSGWMTKPSMLYAVSRNTDHPDEAAAFVDFLLNNGDCAEILGTTRGIPSSRYALGRLEEKGMLRGPAQDSNELLGSLDTITVSPYAELARVREYCNTALENVSYGTQDIPSAASELYSSLSDYLEKIRK